MVKVTIAYINGDTQINEYPHWSDVPDFLNDKNVCRVIEEGDAGEYERTYS
jgi:hypothetical protein